MAEIQPMEQGKARKDISRLFHSVQERLEVLTQNRCIVGCIVRYTAIILMRLQHWNGKVSSLGRDVAHKQGHQGDSKDAHLAAGEMHDCGLVRGSLTRRGDVMWWELRGPNRTCPFWEESFACRRQ